MTLVLIAMNQRFAVQISDRRLSNRLHVLEEEENKTFILHAPDGRFTVGYIGIARVGQFTTSRWIQEKLVQLGKLVGSTEELIKRFSVAAGKTFSADPSLMRVSHDSLVLEVSFAGYLNTRATPIGVFAKVANGPNPFFFDVDFSRVLPGSENAYEFFHALGSTRGLRQNHIDQVEAALRRSIRPQGLVEILANQVRSIAEDRVSGIAIGKQLDYVILDPRLEVSPIGGYLSAYTKPDIRMPAVIFVGHGGGALSAT